MSQTCPQLKLAQPEVGIQKLIRFIQDQETPYRGHPSQMPQSSLTMNLTNSLKRKQRSLPLTNRPGNTTSPKLDKFHLPSVDCQQLWAVKFLRKIRGNTKGTPPDATSEGFLRDPRTYNCKNLGVTYSSKIGCMYPT